MIKKYPRFIYKPSYQIVNGNMSIEYEVSDGKIINPEIIYDLEFRNIEEYIKKIHYFKCIPLCSRISFVDNLTCEELFALSVENLCNMNVPKRAQYLRVLVLELARINGFFTYISSIAHSIEFETAKIWALTDRFKTMQIIEQITGNADYPCYIMPGGVHRDISSILMDNITKYLSYLYFRLDDYDKLLFQNEILVDRTRNVGTIDNSIIKKFGGTGFVAKSSGIAFDLRKTLKYEVYGNMEITVKTFDKSDVLNRILSKRSEMEESIKIIRNVLENIPNETVSYSRPFESVFDFKVPSGISVQRVEGVNGEFVLLLSSDGGVYPQKVHFKGPSFINGNELLKFALKNATMDDLDLIIASLGIIPMEIVR